MSLPSSKTAPPCLPTYHGFFLSTLLKIYPFFQEELFYWLRQAIFTHPTCGIRFLSFSTQQMYLAEVSNIHFICVYLAFIILRSVHLCIVRSCLWPAYLTGLLWDQVRWCRQQCLHVRMLGAFIQERGTRVSSSQWSSQGGSTKWRSGVRKPGVWSGSDCVTLGKSHSFIYSTHTCPEMRAWLWVQWTLDGLMGSPLQPDLSQKMEVGGIASVDYKWELNKTLSAKASYKL